MIQQRPAITQSYRCPKTRKTRQRPVRQFAKLKLEGQAFKVPARKSKWGRLVDKVFMRAA